MNYKKISLLLITLLFLSSIVNAGLFSQDKILLINRVNISQSLDSLCNQNNSFLYRFSGLWGCGQLNTSQMNVTITFNVTNVTYYQLNESDPLSLHLTGGNMSGDINMFNNNINNISYLMFNQLPQVSCDNASIGQLFYDVNNNALSYKWNGVCLQIGEEQVTPVRNNLGFQINNCQAVYISGALGSQTLVNLTNSLYEDSSYILGLATQDIPDNGQGKVTIQGLVHDCDTSMWNDGDELFISTIYGNLTNIRPIAPLHGSSVGIVVRKHATQGIILVSINNGKEMCESDDVVCNNKIVNQVLTWNGTVWNNNDVPYQSNSSGWIYNGINITTNRSTNVNIDGNVTIPNYLLVGSNPAVTSQTTQILVTSGTGQQPAIEIRSEGANAALIGRAYGVGRFPTFSGRQAAGNITNPNYTIKDAIIMRFGGTGFDGNAFLTTNRASIDFRAAENYNSTNQGAYIIFATTAIGSTVLTDRLKIGDNGNIGISTNSPSGRLDVHGNDTGNSINLQLSDNNSVAKVTCLNNGNCGFGGSTVSPVNSIDTDRLCVGTCAGITSVSANNALITGNVTINGLSPNMSVFTDSNKQLITRALTRKDITTLIYKPYKINLTVGSSTETLVNLTNCSDNSVYNLNETNGVNPAMNLTLYFANVSTFTKATILASYNGASPHNIPVRIKKVDNGYFVRTTIGQSQNLFDYSMDFFNSADYIESDGNVTMTLIHEGGNGNPSHVLSIDCIGLLG